MIEPIAGLALSLHDDVPPADAASTVDQRPKPAAPCTEVCALACSVHDAAGTAVGSVQLAPCLKPSGRHRGELMKLLLA